MPEPIPLTYRVAMGVCVPVVRRWGRLEVVNLELLPDEGPVLFVANHDSYWDPVTVGVAAVRRRQLRALAKDSLWKFPGLKPILDRMGQIPIVRGAGDVVAISRAVDELNSGACLGVFPEGTRSKGERLAARGGITRLARAAPEATLVCAAITGTVDIARFPKRPRIRIEFFLPDATVPADSETDREFAARLLASVRARAPAVTAGRKR